jgi:hypothetical protein
MCTWCSGAFGARASQKLVKVCQGSRDKAHRLRSMCACPRARQRSKIPVGSTDSLSGASVSRLRCGRSVAMAEGCGHAIRHVFAVAPRSDALHGRGDKVTASSEVFQLSFNHGLHHNSAYSQTTAPGALRVGSDAKRILAQFHIQIMTQAIDYIYI